MRRVLLACFILVLVGTLGIAQVRKFEGVTITVFTQPPPYIAKPVMMFAPDWQKATGARINLITAPWGELYTKMYASFALGEALYDIVIFPAAWLPDFAAAGFLVPLDDFIAKDPYIQWEDILPVYRERIASWEGKVYAVPLDGDCHIFYYRKDALENPEYQAEFKEKYGYDLPVPPRTWKEVRDIAEFFNGWDWDGDGQIEYGVVEPRRYAGQADWCFFSRTVGYVALPGQPGGLFFDPETMTPRINSPGHVRALEDYVAIMKYGVPGMINMDSGEIRSVFAAGLAAMAIDWGDIGVISEVGEESTVRGKVGYAVLPGSDEVWDFAKGQWVKLPVPNQAGYLAFGGWVAGIAHNSKHKEAAYDFISYLARPENSYISVTTSETGFNPYRYTHFTKLSGWIGMGFSPEAAEAYLKAIQDTIGHPNVQPDLRIPGQARYFEAVDRALSRVAAGELAPKAALDEVARVWNEITDSLGRDKQLLYYRLSLGLPPK
ncbi:MAG: sugar ABC transporter substrate-binding protein [Candidatus Bathyarchaeia archaeon]|uniref:ABC transporter substrate-binding protein n=1 Tax=Thermofilum sp. TaxID=1961369 RepID=UPI0031747240